MEESQRVDAKTPKQRISRKQVEDEERTPAEDETEDDASDSEEDLELLRLEEIGIHPMSKSDLSPEEVDKKQRKRRLLAEELLQTERIYVGDLDLLWDVCRTSSPSSSSPPTKRKTKKTHKTNNDDDGGDGDERKKKMLAVLSREDDGERRVCTQVHHAR